MNKYRVKEGSHREGRRVFVKGAVVETHLDLNKLFPGKFKIIKGPKPDKSEPPIPGTDENFLGSNKQPRAAVIGTKAESDESKEEDGETPLSQQAQEDDEESAKGSDDDSDEGDEEETPKRSAKASTLKKKKRST